MSLEQSWFHTFLHVSRQATLVHSNETTRLRFFIDLLVANNKPILLIGNAGLGKTVLINYKLGRLDENFTIANIPFNFYTTSEMLQRILEKPLEKKAGRNYGPPGSNKLIYFVDDLNMPEVCGTLLGSARGCDELFLFPVFSSYYLLLFIIYYLLWLTYLQLTMYLLDWLKISMCQSMSCVECISIAVNDLSIGTAFYFSFCFTFINILLFFMYYVFYDLLFIAF